MHLPPNLLYLSVGENELSGMVDLTRLPVTIECLYLNQNNFEGKTDLSQLPAGLEELDVSYTKLSGEIVAPNPTTIYKVEHSNVQLIQP